MEASEVGDNSGTSAHEVQQTEGSNPLETDAVPSQGALPNQESSEGGNNFGISADEVQQTEENGSLGDVDALPIKECSEECDNFGMSADEVQQIEENTPVTNADTVSNRESPLASIKRSHNFEVGAYVEVIDNDRLYPAVVTSIVDDGTVGVKYFEFEGEDQRTHVTRLRKMPTGPFNNKNARNKLFIGASVLCKYPEDGEYYNAIVTEFTTRGCMVYYTEYGDSQEVPLQYLVPRPTTPRAPSSSFAGDVTVVPSTIVEDSHEGGDYIPTASNPAASSSELVVDVSRPPSAAYEELNDDFLSSPPSTLSNRSKSSHRSNRSPRTPTSVPASGVESIVISAMSNKGNSKKKKVSFHVSSAQVDDSNDDIDLSATNEPLAGDTDKLSASFSIDMDEGLCLNRGSHNNDVLNCENDIIINNNNNNHIADSDDHVKDHYYSGDATNVDVGHVNISIDSPRDEEKESSPEPEPQRQSKSAFAVLKKSFSFKRKKSKFRKWTREEMILLLVSMGIQIRSEDTVPTLMLRDECDKRFKHSKKMPTKPVPLQGNVFYYTII